jgi:hypothetical protein
MAEGKRVRRYMDVVCKHHLHKGTCPQCHRTLMTLGVVKAKLCQNQRENNFYWLSEKGE